MLSNPWIRLINNWAHDVGSGLWAACVFVIWLLESETKALAVDGVSAVIGVIGGVQSKIFTVLVVALVVITITGIFRLVYWRRETAPELMPAKRPALIGKHIAFLVIYGGGTVWAYLLLGQA